MATQDEVELLKRLVNDQFGELTDMQLGVLIDSLTMNGAAAQLWREVAAKNAALVDITESGSSRKMSSVYTNAMTMAKYYQNMADAAVETTQRATRIKRIVRA